MSKAKVLKEMLMLKLYGKKPSLAKHLVGGAGLGGTAGAASMALPGKTGFSRMGEVFGDELASSLGRNFSAVSAAAKRGGGRPIHRGIAVGVMSPLLAPVAALEGLIKATVETGKRGAVGAGLGAGGGAALYAKRMAAYNARAKNVNRALMGAGAVGGAGGLAGLLAKKSDKK